MTVNCYAKASRASLSNISDRFPVNSYVGDADQVLECLRKLFANEQAGIARVEVVIDQEHPANMIGRSPQVLI